MSATNNNTRVWGSFLANSKQQVNLTLEKTDLEYLLSNSNENSPPLDGAMPYQEGSQSRTSISSTSRHYTASESPDVNPNATCWEILTLRLGRFARQHIEKHGAGSVTDEMLQREARTILYGDPDDVWNQTSADNPEWLSLFKKAHGIGSPAPATGKPD